VVAPARATATIFLVVKGRGVDGQKTSFLLGSVGGGEEMKQISTRTSIGFLFGASLAKKWLEGKEERYNDRIPTCYTHLAHQYLSGSLPSHAPCQPPSP
jgi:hypothetical protein